MLTAALLICACLPGCAGDIKGETGNTGAAGIPALANLSISLSSGTLTIADDAGAALS